MKKGNIILLILALSIFISCLPSKEEIPEFREFIFKNYTNNNYLNTAISVGKIKNDTIFIKHSENFSEIKPKGNSLYFETTTGKKEIWDFYLLEFINSTEDLGCFLIEFSDTRKIFIEIEYGEYGIGVANLFEIKISDNNVTTPYNTEIINNIPIDQFKIIY